MYSPKILVFLLICAFLRPVFSIECYICSIAEKDGDKSCADDPEKAGVVKKNCNKKYCTIIRQEYKDPKNRIATFARGCEDKPLGLNTVQEDSTFRIYYTACQQDLCNSGSGKSADTGNKVGALGDKSTLYVPGIGSNSWTSKASIFTIIMCGILKVFYS